MGGGVGLQQVFEQTGPQLESASIVCVLVHCCHGRAQVEEMCVRVRVCARAERERGREIRWCATRVQSKWCRVAAKNQYVNLLLFPSLPLSLLLFSLPPSPSPSPSLPLPPLLSFSLPLPLSLPGGAATVRGRRACWAGSAASWLPYARQAQPRGSPLRLQASDAGLF